MKWAVVTGASGFLGRYLVHELARQGWQVAGIGPAAPDASLLRVASRWSAWRLPCPFLPGLLRELQPEVLVHAAGRASVPDSLDRPAADFDSGPPLVFHLLDQVRQHSPATRFVFLSSAAVYGNPQRLPIQEDDPAAPLSPYGHHKLMGEQLCREFHDIYGLATTALRIFSAYGPGLRRQVVWDLCRKLRDPAEVSGGLTLRGAGTESRDFIHAVDVARAAAFVARHGDARGAVYNVATGCEITIADLAGRIARLLGADATPRFDGLEPPGMPRNWRADVTRLDRLGFRPQIAFDAGLAETIAWCAGQDAAAALSA
jgi:UDP-glucose 4-epimerase